MGNPTNEDRATWAEAAINSFAEITGMDEAGEDGETIVTDLLADVAHYCRANGIDFEGCLQTAEMHFTEEVEEETP